MKLCAKSGSCADFVCYCISICVCSCIHTSVYTFCVKVETERTHFKNAEGTRWSTGFFKFLVNLTIFHSVVFGSTFDAGLAFTGWTSPEGLVLVQLP